MAFRYRFPGQTGVNRTVTDELTQFVLPASIDTVWAGKDNRDSEPEIEKLDPAEAVSKHINIPMTAELGDAAGYISIMEGGVTTSFPQINLEAKGNGVYQSNISWSDNKSYTAAGDITTGWRLVNDAEDLNALVNNYNIYKVNPNADAELYADTSYVQPGRATWTWLTDYGNPSCTDPKYSEQFMEAASKLGFEYSVIDEGWYTKQNPAWHDSSLETETYVPALTKLGDAGKALNVKPILWTGVTSDPSRCLQVNDLASAQAFVDLMKKTGMAGAKIDFWAGEDQPNLPNRGLELQEAFIKMCAEEKLLVNFHGINEPTGMSVTYPNEITREAIRGLENIGSAANTNYATQARFLTRQLFTRYLAGHADWTPAVNTAMQIATLICIDSPMNVIATHPNDILANPALEMIKSIPTVWDQTKVLPVSEIDKLAVYAKESGGAWFLGGIHHNEENTDALQVRFPYDFLGEGSYNMELWVDQPDGTKEKFESVVTNKDAFRQNIPANAGFAARFTKLSASQYGGEIREDAPLAFTAMDEDAVIKYTLDGTDPLLSETAVTYSQPIALEGSCKVRAAIVSGDGAGTEFAHQFNAGKLELASDIEYGRGETPVNLTTNNAADIYYTYGEGQNPDDVAAPTADSDKYAAPLSFQKDGYLKVLAVSKKDGAETASTIKIGIKNQLPSAIRTPDVHITDDTCVDATTGFAGDPYNFDKNCKGGAISIAGTTYDRGLGTNANGYFVYNVPQNAKRLVGVVGIDDVVKENVNDGNKASGNCIIYIDGKEVWSSVVFLPDEYIYFDVAVPAGSKQVKIALLDGGDGITCDNISVGNVGWIGQDIEIIQYEPLDPAVSYITKESVIESQSGWADYNGVDAWKDGTPIKIADKYYSKGLVNHSATDGSAKFKLNIPENAKSITGVGGVDVAACQKFCDDDAYKTEAKANFTFIFRNADGGEVGSQTTANAAYGESVDIDYAIPEGAATVEIQFLAGGRENANFGYASIGNLGFTTDVAYVTADMIVGSQSGWGNYAGLDHWTDNSGVDFPITIADVPYTHGLTNHSAVDGSAFFKINVPAGAKTLTGVGGVDTAACQNLSDNDAYKAEAKANFKFIFRNADGAELGTQTTDNAAYGQSLNISYAIPAGTATVEIQFLTGGRGDNRFGYASIGNLAFVK